MTLTTRILGIAAVAGAIGTATPTHRALAYEACGSAGQYWCGSISNCRGWDDAGKCTDWNTKDYYTDKKPDEM